MGDWRQQRMAYVNIAIMITNVLCFLYLEIRGSTDNTMFMLRSGAMYAPLVVDQGQYYRLITSMFMHFGASHLMNNMLVLFVLGDKLEAALGHVKYFIFYMLCGIGAGIVSMLVEMQTGNIAVGAGASGAIFGVVGGLVYAVGVNHGRLGSLTRRQLGVMLLFALYQGFTSIDVDNSAHIGGLVTGILLGILLYRKPKRAVDV